MKKCIIMVTTCWLLVQPIFAEPVQDIGALLGEAIEDINFQDFDIAERKLTQVLQVEPENPYAKYYMASLLTQTKRAKEAVPYLESIKDSANLFPDYQRLLASTYMAAGTPEKAIPIYKAMLEENPLDEENMFQYANALEQNGEYNRAMAYYHQLIKTDSAYADAAHFQLANIMMIFGANRHANEQFGRIADTSAYAATVKAYQTSLAPALKPFGLYLSAEYFVNDNPGSASSTYAKGAVPQAAPQSSAGQTWVASLSSAAWEINYKLQTKFAYTYYTTLYRESFAKSNDFTGHFFAPTLTYAFSPQLKLEGKIDYQILNLGEYNLSHNYGGALNLRYTAKDSLSSWYASISYIRKRYNQAFGDVGAKVNMQYLDANSPTLGAGGYIIYSDAGAMFSMDYSLLFERTLTNTNAVLNEKAQDSVFREHSLSLNHHLPLDTISQGLSFDVSAGYTFRNYLNPQSGTSLPSIKPGNYFTAQTTTASAKIQYGMGTAYNLNVVLGYDWTKATSQATELSYDQTRYYTQLSGSF